MTERRRPDRACSTNRLAPGRLGGWRYGAAIVAAACLLTAPLARAAPVPAAGFDAYLAEGYRQLAAVAARSGPDAGLAAHFRKRSVLAARGDPVLPQDIGLGELDPWTLHEASFARKELVARLDAGARQHQPLLAAMAQVNFDCWVVPLPHRLGVPDDDQCRRRFYFALAGLPQAYPPNAGAPGKVVAVAGRASQAALVAPALVMGEPSATPTSGAARLPHWDGLAHWWDFFFGIGPSRRDHGQPHPP